MWPWRRRNLSPRAASSANDARAERRVDDRAFLLGLDELYREVIKRHETGALLDSARTVAAHLGLERDGGAPLEGYYGESPHLTEYFQWMRSLQSTPAERVLEVADLPAYKRLLALASSPHLGRPIDTGKLLPRARDALAAALLATRPDWTISAVMNAAKVSAHETGDVSLVGLAALAGDDVAVAALRETVVLYAELIVTGIPQPVKHDFVWEVSPELAARAARFVESVNALLGENLPAPIAASAEEYWYAFSRNKVVGRCVRIASDERQVPHRHYHWAIKKNEDRLVVEEFWDTRVWTTDMYRQAQRDR
jgi:hypothetical protein